MSDGDDLSCDGSSSDDLSMEAAAWWYNAAQICAAEWKKLKHDRKMSGKQYIMRQLNGHHMVCYDNYRVSTANLYRLCDELRAKGLQYNGDVIIEEHVGMFLQMIGQGSTMRKITEDFQHSEETVSRCIRNVLQCVMLMKSDYIKLPGVDAPIHPKLKQSQFLPFKDALGAIDGTHINAFPPSGQTFKERWRDRKGNIVPPGRYYLVDGGYANTPQFLSPYRGKTYHLAQFSTRGRENRYDCAEELYNYRHAQLRNIVEKTFGILKGRFKICKEMHKYKYDMQTDLVIACCILHNFIKRHQHDNSYDGSSDDEVDSDNATGLGNDDEDGSEYSGTATQVGGAMRDRIRDMLWDNR
ncbi:hypothetical protein LUZ61_010556 [Rhynchospora tenuis]|uniref:DDE Tnp4 domain-containing protein n=1 Tax=Rhynchospora tenuis TaxID=198213 RepID=A0AAD5ZZA3_9POAL|nr:hypothetical protein LUZ61_010556 [Rhynchospora tenuis]